MCLSVQAEDVDVDGLPKSASRSKYDLDGGGGQVSLLIRVSHKVRFFPSAYKWQDHLHVKFYQASECCLYNLLCSLTMRVAGG